jgi:hypothetical protein
MCSGSPVVAMGSVHWAAERPVWLDFPLCSSDLTLWSATFILFLQGFGCSKNQRVVSPTMESGNTIFDLFSNRILIFSSKAISMQLDFSHLLCMFYFFLLM